MIDGKYLGELLNNQFVPGTRTQDSEYCAEDEERRRHRSLVLAGTELPLLLLLRDSDTPGIEFLDTTVIHVEAIVDELLRRMSELRGLFPVGSANRKLIQKRASRRSEPIGIFRRTTLLPSGLLTIVAESPSRGTACA